MSELHRPSCVRQVDDLGRIVLQKEMRDLLRLGNRAQVLMRLTDEGILLTPFQPGCRVCGDLPGAGLFELSDGHLVCPQCASEVAAVAARARALAEAQP
jgi:transcriptional pleiotropic regulator of transition state genes